MRAWGVWMRALSGDEAGARLELGELLRDDLARMRHPDVICLGR